MAKKRGRPRKYDYSEIIRLWREGKTIVEIVEILGLSGTSVVKNAIRNEIRRLERGLRLNLNESIAEYLTRLHETP